jgi:hypothetical protein
VKTVLVEMILSSSVEVLGANWFYECRSLSLVAFESESKLSRIENAAFVRIDLVKIILPASVKVLGERCFDECRSISSVTVDSGSVLSRIEKLAFC